MDSGDSIMISAKVIACVDEIDCSPVTILFAVVDDVVFILLITSLLAFRKL
jgi:hypothetical protein